VIFAQIGDRGITLSGGQRARLCLARAVYADRDIYVLDDPLSAVDARVGRHIFEHCIRTLLKDKLVILATHQIQFLQHSQSMLVMSEAGQIIGLGAYSSLMQKPTVRNLLHMKSAKGKQDADGVNKFARMYSNVSTCSVKLSSARESVSTIVAESQETGQVSKKTYRRFFLAAGSPSILLAVLVLTSMAQATQVSNRIATQVDFSLI
jgi:ATP-binding cassette, subfamily C (CFTR/MRP), member 4